MRKALAVTLVSIAALALATNVASAQRGGDHGGGGGGGSAAVSGGGGKGGGARPSFGGGGKGGGGPSHSFNAPSGKTGGYSRPAGGYSRGAVMHAPRQSAGSAQHHRAAPLYSPRTVHQYRASPQYRVSPHAAQHESRTTRQPVGPNVVQHAPVRQHTSKTYTRRRMQVVGAHHRRYRHRRHGYTYNYGGWWYASPWWLYSDYYYWSEVCASRWGYYTPGYYSCMAYYGFY
jgi:hypothetical protein